MAKPELRGKFGASIGDMSMNTRKYSRTLAEAFPYGPEYGCAIERPAPNPYPRLLWWAMLIGAVAAVVAAIYS